MELLTLRRAKTEIPKSMSKLKINPRVTIQEKKELFEYILDFGIPINSEGKPNWAEVRENFYGYNSRYDAKSVHLIEKLVQEFR